MRQIHYITILLFIALIGGCHNTKKPDRVQASAAMCVSGTDTVTLDDSLQKLQDRLYSSLYLCELEINHLKHVRQKRHEAAPHPVSTTEIIRAEDK